MTAQKTKQIKTFEELNEEGIVRCDIGHRTDIWIVSYIKKTFIHKHQYIKLTNLYWDMDGNPVFGNSFKVFLYDDIKFLNINKIE